MDAAIVNAADLMRGQLVVPSTTIAIRREARLLISEIRIGRDQHVERFFLCDSEQFPVFQRRPTALVSRDYLVLRRHPALRRWRALVEKDAHLGRGKCAARGMLQ